MVSIIKRIGNIGILWFKIGHNLNVECQYFDFQKFSIGIFEKYFFQWKNKVTVTKVTDT